MGYEVTIRCDSGTGDPLNKQVCANYTPRQSRLIRREASTSREAIYAVERQAKAHGWLRVRSAGRRDRWVCPVCQGRAATVR